jgi:hypothetical protein
MHLTVFFKRLQVAFSNLQAQISVKVGNEKKLLVSTVHVHSVHAPAGVEQVSRPLSAPVLLS